MQDTDEEIKKIEKFLNLKKSSFTPLEIKNKMEIEKIHFQFAKLEEIKLFKILATNINKNWQN